jgi:putative addiction module killer protein
MKLLEYADPQGRSPFRRWFDRLDAIAASKVTAALARVELGNTSNVRGVGAGVFELKIDFGPGYRVYFGKDDEEIVILLGGGSKRNQQEDIVDARSRWKDFKQRKGTKT